MQLAAGPIYALRLHTTLATVPTMSFPTAMVTENPQASRHQGYKEETEHHKCLKRNDTASLSCSSTSLSTTQKSVGFESIAYVAYIEPSDHWFTRSELRKMRLRDAYLWQLHQHNLPINGQHSRHGLVSPEPRQPTRAQRYVVEHAYDSNMPKRYRRLSKDAVQQAWQRAQGNGCLIEC